MDLLSAPELGIAVAVILVGGTVMGLAGFGIGMVSSPILLLIIDPEFVVINTNGLSILVMSLLLFQSRRDIPMGDALPLPLAGLLGAPVGVLILSSATTETLRIAIAAVILSLAVLSTLNWQRPLPRTSLVGPLFAFAGAVLVTGAGVGAPLVALFLINQRWHAPAMRASLAFWYLPVAILATVLYGVTGLYTLERVWLVLSLAPAALAGFVVASYLVNRLDAGLLRRVILAVVIASSVALLIREALRL